MLLVHWLAGLVGAYLVYVSFVMTESAEGRWNNRLEELWIQADDKRRGAMGRTFYLFSRIANAVSNKLTALFGDKLISWRLVGVSSSLSFASLGLTLGFGLIWLLSLFEKNIDKAPPNLVKELPLLFVLAFVLTVFGSAMFVLALLPTFFQARFWVILSCVPVTLFFYALLRLFRHRLLTQNESGMAASLVSSILCDFIVIILLRKSLRWVMQHMTDIKIVLISLLQMVAACLVINLPYRISMIGAMHKQRDVLTQAFFFLTVFNVPTALFCVAIDVLLFGMLAHRIFWPAMSQWTYALARKDVFERRKTIRSLGAILLMYSGTGHSGLMWKLIDKLK